jgi:hypothetical protein
MGLFSIGAGMTAAAVEPLSALRFPLDVAKEAPPIEGVVECVRQERARLPTYRPGAKVRFQQKKRQSLWNTKDLPFTLFLIRVSKEDDLLILGEY